MKLHAFKLICGPFQVFTNRYNRNTTVCFARYFSSFSENAMKLSYSSFEPNQCLSNIPVIILHGLLGSKQNWRTLGKVICLKSNKTVYTLDARNHGDSPHSEDFNYDLMALDVKHFMKSKTINKAILIGHSMGGRTAIKFALTEPNLVQKLVAVDISPKRMPRGVSHVVPGYMTAMENAIKTVSGMKLTQARTHIDKYLAQSIPEEGIRQFLLTNLSEKDGLLWKPNLKVLKDKFESSIVDFSLKPAQYFGETLFVCGGSSPYVKKEDYSYIESIFPKAEFVEIPDAGHWVHSERPAEFLNAVHKFLDT